MPLEITDQTNFIKKAMAAVSDSYRQRILQEILGKGAITCTDIMLLTGLSQPACSHHIKLLMESELIERKKEGRQHFFSINKENFKKLGFYFEQFSNC